MFSLILIFKAYIKYCIESVLGEFVLYMQLVKLPETTECYKVPGVQTGLHCHWNLHVFSW